MKHLERESEIFIDDFIHKQCGITQKKFNEEVSILKISFGDLKNEELDKIATKESINKLNLTQQLKRVILKIKNEYNN